MNFSKALIAWCFSSKGKSQPELYVKKNLFLSYSFCRCNKHVLDLSYAPSRSCLRCAKPQISHSFITWQFSTCPFKPNQMVESTLSFVSTFKSPSQSLIQDIHFMQCAFSMGYWRQGKAYSTCQEHSVFTVQTNLLSVFFQNQIKCINPSVGLIRRPTLK